MNETMQHVAMRLGAMGFRRQRLGDIITSYPIERELKRHRGSRSYRKECGCGTHVDGNDYYEILLHALRKDARVWYEEQGQDGVVALIMVRHHSSSKHIPNLCGGASYRTYWIPIPERYKRAVLDFSFDCMSPKPNVI